MEIYKLRSFKMIEMASQKHLPQLAGESLPVNDSHCEAEGADCELVMLPFTQSNRTPTTPDCKSVMT